MNSDSFLNNSFLYNRPNDEYNSNEQLESPFRDEPHSASANEQVYFDWPYPNTDRRVHENEN